MSITFDTDTLYPRPSKSPSTMYNFLSNRKPQNISPSLRIQSEIKTDNLKNSCKLFNTRWIIIYVTMYNRTNNNTTSTLINKISNSSSLEFIFRFSYLTMETENTRQCHPLFRCVKQNKKGVPYTYVVQLFVRLSIRNFPLYMRHVNGEDCLFFRENNFHWSRGFYHNDCFRVKNDKELKRSKHAQLNAIPDTLNRSCGWSTILTSSMKVFKFFFLFLAKNQPLVLAAAGNIVNLLKNIYSSTLVGIPHGTCAIFVLFSFSISIKFVKQKRN